jgi:hypothetical protein
MGRNNLRSEHIVKDNNGNWWIRKTHEKTNNMCNIPLLNLPLQILEKYADNPYYIEKGILQMVMCNQKMNSYLKEIADFCGISRRYSCALANSKLCFERPETHRDTQNHLLK